MSKAPEEVKLQDGDGLSLSPEVKEFRFGCCDCGLVHRITVDREGVNIVLKFHRETKKYPEAK